MNPSVKSAGRVLDILELFASSEVPLTLRDVAAVLGLPKSSTHGLLGTLVGRGYLQRLGRDRYELTTALAGAGGWVGGQVALLSRAAGPTLDRLLERFQETVVYAMPTPSLEVRILAHRTSPLAIRFDPSTAATIPGYCTALGQAILSQLPEEEVRDYLARTDLVALTPRTVTDPETLMERLRQCRARGFSLNIDERIEGASGAAAAILDPEGRPRAAVNIVTLTPRFRAKQAAIVAGLIEAAREIEAAAFGAPSRARESALGA